SVPDRARVVAEVETVSSLRLRTVPPLRLRSFARRPSVAPNAGIRLSCFLPQWQMRTRTPPETASVTGMGAFAHCRASIYRFDIYDASSEAASALLMPPAGWRFASAFEDRHLRPPNLS